MKANSILELVHCDLAGPIEPVAKEGFRYALGFINDYSGILMIYFIKQKSDSLKVTENFLSDCSPYMGLLNVAEVIMGQNLLLMHLSPFLLSIVLNMKSLLHIHPIKMGQLKGLGGQPLKWPDVCCLNPNCLSIYGHML